MSISVNFRGFRSASQELVKLSEAVKTSAKTGATAAKDVYEKAKEYMESLAGYYQSNVQTELQLWANLQKSLIDGGLKTQTA